MVKPSDKPFDIVSLIYDGLMAEIDYRHWADYIAKIAELYITSDSAVLELAAGNCRLSHHLSVAYPKILATDISSSMLKSDIKNEIKKVCCDMKALPFNGKFDFIFSTFDSINYLQNKEALLKLFAEVYAVLNSDGVFTFDVSMKNNSLREDSLETEEGIFNGYSYIKKSKFLQRRKIHKNIFYISDKDGVTYKEVHRQKIFNFDTYFYLIERSGLYVSNCYEAFSFEDGSEDSERLQFVLKKEN